MRVLSGDIGGTNARLIIHEVASELVSSTSSVPLVDQLKTHTLIYQDSLKNADYSSFSSLFESFLSSASAGCIDIAVLAVAGPVADNRIKFTNHDNWIVDGSELSQKHSIPTFVLINDFVANGYGLLGLDHEKDVIQIQEGKKDIQKGVTVLIGAGTGLGECFVVPDEEGGVVTWATEGGHATFGGRTEEERELGHWIGRRLGENKSDAHVSVERVVSGMGLENIYEWMRQKYETEIDTDLDGEYEKCQEKAQFIGEHKEKYILFERTMEMMFGVYGSELGNCALKFLPWGGLYIAGGIAPKNKEYVINKDSLFMKRFADKGRMSDMMKQFPIYLVTVEDLGVRGAHMFATKKLGEQSECSQKEFSKFGNGGIIASIGLSAAACMLAGGYLYQVISGKRSTSMRL